MSGSQRYTSFLIRLWREREHNWPGPAGDWRGEVEHIQSGQRWSFDSLDELLSWLRRQVEDQPGPNGPADS